MGRRCIGVGMVLWLLVPAALWGGSFEQALVAAALDRTRETVRYDGSYHAIDYPGGDVPAGIGVCTDVIVRAYRAVGTDLQRLVHEDMAAAFSAYPSRRIWGLTAPDPNIDHRRVPNLMTFFKRRGAALPISNRPEDYKPGDIVAWDLGGGVTHIGIVVGIKSPDKRRHLIVHNIGAGTEIADGLFGWKIIGHFRYFGESN